jgi:Predicted periplasmic protein
MMRLWLLPALLLPLASVTHAACTLTDPSLQVQSYEVDRQQENITLRWKKPDGKAWGSLYSLLADINGNGQVLMAMNGGIYGKDYAPLGLYIEKGKKLAPVNRASGGGNFFIRPGGVFYLKDQKDGEL